MMEQRWSPRTRVDLDVDIIHGGVEIDECKTRDIGMGGVYVELSRDLPAAQAPVELVFKLGSGPTFTRHRLKATVVRVEAKGVGLMFRDFDASTFRSLQEVIRYVQNIALH